MRTRLWPIFRVVSALGLFAILAACGGGRSASGGSSSPSDFALAVSPSSLPLQSGTGDTVQITVTPFNSFSGTVQVQVSNVPSGITLSQTQFSVSPSSGQSVTVSTTSSAAAGNYSLTFQGSSGSEAHSATLTVAVSAAIPPPSRADFVPTYDTPESAAYDLARKLVYVSNPTRGTVDVVSSTTYQVLKSIPIPLPRGLNLSVDGSKVYVGTDTQALYVIDTATQRISQRYFTPVPPPIGLGYYASAPENPVDTANGRLLLLAMNSGSIQITSWDLATNTYQVRSDAPSSFDYGVLARSGDGTKVILANNVSGGVDVALYDSLTDSFKSTTLGYPFAVAANADGTQFAVASDQIYVFDSQLNQVSVLPASAPLQYSPDGSRLYVAGFLGSVPVVAIFDMQTYKLVGWARSYASNIAYFERVPPLIQEKPLVADETGRLFGAADHGLAIDDTMDLHSYSGTEEYPVDNIVVVPSEGTTVQQQNVQIETYNYTTAPNVWFGGFSASNTQVGDPYLATTTPGLETTGPVNVRLIDTDGVQSFIPQSYSYGSVLVPTPDLAASSAGGGSLSVFGYGLGVLGTQQTTKLSVGNTPAQVTQAHPFATAQEYPFAMTYLQFQPPSTGAGAGDVTVTSAAGAATFKGGYHSLGMTGYALDAQPYGIVYDSHRNQVYISTADYVDVFSLASASFLAPIAIPTINKVLQLGGMALSPDGSRLVVTNWADGSVAIVNPDHPSSAQVVAVVPPANSTPWLQGPQEVAVGNNGKALISVAGEPTGTLSSSRHKEKKRRRQLSAKANDSWPAPNLWELDLNTLTVTPVVSIGENAQDTLSLKASDDGSKICLVGEYQPLSLYDSATGTFLQGPVQAGASDCAANGTATVDGGTPFGRPALLDLALDFNGFVSLTDYMAYSVMNAEPGAIGLLVDPEGALFCQPFTQGLMLFDVHTGQILEQIAMPTNVAGISSGALAWDTAGLRIFALTDSGLTVVHLDSLPLAIGHVTSQGSTWTVSGTGFVQGTSVSADGTSLNTTFVNGQTLKVAGAPSLGSVEEITLTNPNDRSYTIAAAFVR